MSSTMSFSDYLSDIADPEHRAQLKAVLDEITAEFPELDQRVAWNQPMFTDHGTFIIGFSIARTHISIGVEKVALDQFSDRILETGLTRTPQLFQIPWEAQVDEGPVKELLFDIIRFNITDKKDVETFWRKNDE